MSAQPATQLYSRDSTGLVKLGTPWRMICLNFANIGLTYIMFTYWTHPAVFPKSNLILSLVVASLMIVPFTTLYALFASAMPRTGSEYVYLSRTFHPSVGFAASFAAMVTQSFYSGIGGYWLAQLVLSPLLVAFGGITGNDTWVAWGDWCATKEGGLVFGALFVVLMGALNIAGMRIYYKFQEINWWVGVVTLLLMIYVFLSSTQADFVNAFNDYAMRTAGIENAYQATIDKARAEGMDDAGITVRDTLGIIGIVWLLGWASTYIGGEVQTPRRTQLAGTVGGSAIYAVAVIIIALLMAKTVGLEFNKAASYLAYNTEAWELSAWPVFILWAGLLTKNTFLLVLIGIGLIIWSYFWIPSAMIIASRAMFAWAFDRVAPEKLSDVDPRTGSPVTSILTICTLALIFLGLYYLDWFTFLAPMLAYSCVFFLVSLCGIAFPYVEKVRPYYLASGAKTVAGIPLFTLCGIGGAIYYGIAIYFLLTEDGLGVNNTKAITLTALEFVVPFVAYFVIRAVRASQGIMLDRAFQEIPPD